MRPDVRLGFHLVVGAIHELPWGISAEFSVQGRFADRPYGHESLLANLTPINHVPPLPLFGAEKAWQRVLPELIE